MDWIGLICNLVALFAGLAMYIVFVNSETGKKYEQYQYGVMVAVLIIAVLAGGLLKKLFGVL